MRINFNAESPEFHAEAAEMNNLLGRDRFVAVQSGVERVP
jgi:hypothetical protein